MTNAERKWTNTPPYPCSIGSNSRFEPAHPWMIIRGLMFAVLGLNSHSAAGQMCPVVDGQETYTQ